MTSELLPVLPPPYATPSTANFVGWPAGLTPTAPAGFTVSRWAAGLDYPRWFHLLPNGDVLVSEARSLLLPKP
jgi:glucose/arabinose dehydrogenase